MIYNELRVEVSRKAYGEYSAYAEFSSAGPVGGIVTSKSSKATSVFPDPLQITALRSKLASNPSESGLRTLGTILYETLFTGEVERHLWRAQLQTKRQETDLRIQLVIEPNELSALPLELLFDPDTEEFLASSPHTILPTLY
jgi:hypothetical protein